MPALKTNKDGTPHIHIYAAAGGGTPQVDRNPWICLDPDCTTRVNRLDIRGKRSLCTVCRKTEIILTYDDLKRSFPRCFECSDTKQAQDVKKVRQRLQEMGIE